MFNLNRQIINFNDTLFIIKRIIKEEYIKAEFVQNYKEDICADTVLKKDNLFYFVNRVEEAQVVEYL